MLMIGCLCRQSCDIDEALFELLESLSLLHQRLQRLFGGVEDDDTGVPVQCDRITRLDQLRCRAESDDSGNLQ